MTDYSELKRLADACPWEKIKGFEYAAAGGKAYCLGSGPCDHLITTFDNRFQKYIEAANPAVILALIGEVELYRQYGCATCGGSGHMHRLDGEYLGACTSCPAYELERSEFERNQLKAENEALRKDAERYRWIQKTTPYRFKKIQDACVIDGGDVLYFKKPEFDALVDAALSQGEQSSG